MKGELQALGDKYGDHRRILEILEILFPLEMAEADGLCGKREDL